MLLFLDVYEIYKKDYQNVTMNRRCPILAHDVIEESHTCTLAVLLISFFFITNSQWRHVNAVYILLMLLFLDVYEIYKKDLTKIANFFLFKNKWQR